MIANNNFQTAPGFDPQLHVGAYQEGSEWRNVSRADYEAMNETDRLRVQLVKEELHVGKEMREAGEVEVSKRVVEEQVQVPVTLQREEVVVTRHAVDRPADGSTQAFQDEVIRVPIHEERAVVSKEARVTEEIEIEKRATSHEQVVTDTVRHEELDLQGGNQSGVRIDTDNNPNASR